MAQATFESSLIERAKSSATPTILRNHDPLSLALRDGIDLDLADVARLARARSPVEDTLSQGTSCTAVFTSHEGSTNTKPTSSGTAHPHKGYNEKGKEKARLSYASSLSATHGSASEPEVERRAVRRGDLLAMGGWAAHDAAPTPPLRGAVRAKERHPPRRPHGHKKPKVIIKQDARTSPAERTSNPAVGPVVVRGEGKNYLRHRTMVHEEDPLRSAEEGNARHIPSPTTKCKSLSRTRVYVLAGLIVSMVVTLILSAYGSHLTGKKRMSCTKGIVFAATALLAWLTVLAMVTARRALSEALLAGLLEFIFGFALLVELDDFM